MKATDHYFPVVFFIMLYNLFSSESFLEKKHVHKCPVITDNPPAKISLTDKKLNKTEAADKPQTVKQS